MFFEREKGWLDDIVENCDRVSTYISGMNGDAFRKDWKTIDAVERCLLRITEAVIRIGPERMAEIVPSLSQQELRGLGNRLRHEYDDIDLSIIFTSAKYDLPPLRDACAEFLEN